MPNRVNNRDVESAYLSFVARAHREGFNTSHWALVKPDALGAYWRLFHVEALPGEATHRYTDTPFPANLGSTNREAYDRLTAWSQCLDSVKRNRDNRTSDTGNTPDIEAIEREMAYRAEQNGGY